MVLIGGWSSLDHTWENYFKNKQEYCWGISHLRYLHYPIYIIPPACNIPQIVLQSSYYPQIVDLVYPHPQMVPTIKYLVFVTFHKYP